MSARAADAPHSENAAATAAALREMCIVALLKCQLVLRMRASCLRGENAAPHRRAPKRCRYQLGFGRSCRWALRKAAEFRVTAGCDDAERDHRQRKCRADRRDHAGTDRHERAVLAAIR